VNFHNVTVAGCGVLGSQIAFQTAFKGFRVNVYDINDEALEQAKERISKLKPRYREDLGASEEELNAANPGSLSSAIWRKPSVTRTW